MSKYLIIVLLLNCSVTVFANTEADFRLSNHLLNRIAFGASYENSQKLSQLPYPQAVALLLKKPYQTPLTTLPGWTNQAFQRVHKKMTQEEKKALRKTLRKQAQSLRQWWFQEMIVSQHPVQEWMTLFWHGHLTSSVKKVKSPLLMYQQNTVLRKHALGSYREMLHAIAKDPAMLVYLDNRSNRKKQANENFARELLELFTLGEGHYREEDIKAAARAFTGWSLNKQAQYQFKAKQHDKAVKTFMGQTQNFNGDDIINILLDKPQTALNLTEKLWKALVSNEIAKADQAEVKNIANRFYRSNYQIRPWLQDILLSKAFIDESNHNTMIKSPVELFVGLFRQIELPTKLIKNIPKASQRLGQDIFNPPNVKGWPGGEAWITSDTLLMRQAFLSKASRGMEMAGGMMMANPMQAKNAIPTEQLYLWMLPAAKNLEKKEQQDWLTAISHILLEPAYQLK